MSRMFKSIDKTWPVFVGCDFNCTYCNAKKLALTRLKHHLRYKDGFKPHFCPEVLNWKFKPSQFIMVAYMGDISFATSEELDRILLRIQDFPFTNFLIQSKDPSYFRRGPKSFPPNVVLATTIETNRDYHLSKAPTPYNRACHIFSIEHPHKFISIEPIQDFDLEVMVNWIRLIAPDIVEIGYDNYHAKLLEPPLWKTRRLIDELEGFTHVELKSIREAHNDSM